MQEEESPGRTEESLLPSPRLPLSETLRFLYLVLLPLAGLGVLIFEGGGIGKGWGFGIGIGLFLYHYLLWALHETERVDASRGKSPGGMARWSWLLSPALVVVALRANWSEWMIEQTMLETGAFVGAVALLALRKCWDEGRDAPWFLATVVFVLPAIALFWKFGGVWIHRRPEGIAWFDAGFAVALVVSLSVHFRRLFPYVLGGGRLVEPLSTGRRTVLAVVWLIGLLAAGIVAG